MRPEYREEPCRTRPEPGPGHALRLVAQPVHGLRPSLHVLLRPGVRAARRPAVGRPLRGVDPGQDQPRRGPSARARPPAWRARRSSIGAATDPYQPAEGRYRLTRGAIEALAEARKPIAIITRGPMIVRDMDVLAGGRARGRTSASRSRSRRSTRDLAADRARHRAAAPAAPGAADARRRRHRCQRRHGPDPARPVGRPAWMADVVQAARDAGATSIWTNVLYLRPGTREHFLEDLGAGLAGAPAAVRAALRRPGVPRQDCHGADPAPGPRAGRERRDRGPTVDPAGGWPADDGGGDGRPRGSAIEQDQPNQ